MARFSKILDVHGSTKPTATFGSIIDLRSITPDEP